MHSPSQPRFAEPRFGSLVPSLRSSPLSFLATSSALSSPLFIVELLSLPISQKPPPCLSPSIGLNLFVLTHFSCPFEKKKKIYFGHDINATITPEAFWICYSSLAFLKSETTTIMSPKCSEHIEFSMCEKVGIRGIEEIYSAVLPCVKCWYSHWGQAFTPPHLSTNASPSVPLVRDEHGTDVLRPLPGILWVCFRNVDPSLLLPQSRYSRLDAHNVADAICTRQAVKHPKMQIRTVLFPFRTLLNLVVQSPSFPLATFTDALLGLIRFRACPECSGYQIRRQQDSRPCTQRRLQHGV